jgi:hypothetical protein
MAQDFGSGVSRTLSASARQFLQAVWQSSKPPLDSELNLVAQISGESLQNVVRSEMHSGFFLDPMQSDSDFMTSENWSNWFKIGRPANGSTGAAFLWANVNGWVIPVSGSGVSEGDPSNRVNLFNPPATDSRIDLVFLEVWQAQVSPNPSTANKPSASAIYKYGNVGYGGTNISDDIQDPTIGFETTERVQLQYRIRVVGSGTGLGDSVDLAQYPDGLDDPNAIAQGTQAAPVAGYVFNNMGDVLGDRGLWRAGAGDSVSRAALGTVDGYVYAIPMCAVFRRNESAFVALTSSGNANQNGSFNRNPVSGSITVPLQATRTLATVTLAAGIDESATGLVSVTGLAGSGLDNVNIDWTGTVIQIGDEMMVLQGVDAGAGTIQIASITDVAPLTPYYGRGRFGTEATSHQTGAEIKFYTFRPDGVFADQITTNDILDLRRSVTLGEWSYDSLLKHNLSKVLDGSLQSSYKQGNGTDTQGTKIIEVDTFLGKGTGALPNQTEQLDGFDGIRTVFSDSAVVQNDISLLLTPSGGNVSVSGNTWEVAADFSVSGFIPSSGSAWTNGSVISLFLGGASGSDGARATSVSGARFMRFVSPKEYWLSRDEVSGIGFSGNQTPFLMRFAGDGGTAPQSWSQPAGKGEPSANHPGPMFPLPEHDFQSPYMVLGGVVNTLLFSATANTFAGNEVQFTGLNFDLAGQWAEDASSPRQTTTSGITHLLLHGKRNLYDMLTAGGRDLSGGSSELFLILTGGTNDIGVFRVVGAGTIGYTYQDATAADRLILAPVGPASNITGGEVVTAAVRSHDMNTEDNPGTSYAAAVIVITDLAATIGAGTNPWNGLSAASITSDLILDTSILYGPSRGGMARVPDALERFALEQPEASGIEVLREAPENIDPSPSDIRSRIGAPEDEYYYNAQPMQAWNRLPGLGLHAPHAPDYGDGRYNFETLRESELLVDHGSKTVVFRPFQQVNMSLPLRTAAAAQLPTNYDDGVTPIDGAGLFAATSQQEIFAVPPEYMPRFGRQDIPVRSVAGSSGPYYGINHLFSDTPTGADPTRDIIGGTAAAGVLKIVTGAASGLDYGEWNGANSWYQGRLYEDVNARSSDLNKAMRGIQLPPYLGVARVYGIYDKRDYDVNGSAWTDAGFTPDGGVGAGTNLIRTAAGKQTLFLVKDGAADVIANADAHTYVIPEEAVDITLSPNFVVGEVFDGLEYVVEVAVFGFAQGFVNKNNYVLNRNNALSDSLRTSIRMILPAAMPNGVRGYVAHQRTVYQGDPYMTRDGATIQTADYEQRYGQVSVASAFAVNAPLQQYDTNNAQIPEIPNARSLEVLATADFWTTLGTGKIGGPVHAGTPTDAGFLSSPGTRLPGTNTENPYQPAARAFTLSQQADGTYADLVIEITDNTQLTNLSVVLIRGSQTVALDQGVAWAIGADASATARALTNAINGNNAAKNLVAVRAFQRGNAVMLSSYLPGAQGGNSTVSLTLIGGGAPPSGVQLNVPYAYGVTPNQSGLLNGVDAPVNGSRVAAAPTPVGITGMTDRLPLGILVNDSDFLGEDPLRKGVTYEIRSGGGAQATTEVATFNADGLPNAQLSGTLGMADGAVLQYTAYNATSAPDGTRRFRLYRGGGSAYVVDPVRGGGPVDLSAGGMSAGDLPVLKGAVLAGRAYLVRNGYEDAFTGNVVRSYGDEIQMVIVTTAVYGKGLSCEHGYALDGLLSPTDYGKGYAAADRYRLEGKPLLKSASALLDPNIPLAPYPPEDPADDDPCA